MLTLHVWHQQANTIGPFGLPEEWTVVKGGWATSPAMEERSFFSMYGIGRPDSPSWRQLPSSSPSSTVSVSYAEEGRTRGTNALRNPVSAFSLPDLRHLLLLP